MNERLIQLDLYHVGIAAILVVIAGLVSVFLGLRLERQLFIAAFRCLVQLLLVGYVLRWVFGMQHPAALALVLTVMLTVASHAATERLNRGYRFAILDAFFTLTVSGLLTSYLVTGVVMNVRPWYQPQYLIPLLGMILGNGLTGVSLCLDHLLETAQERRAEIEMELALGATWWEAARRPLAEAVKRGLVPTINGMTVVGLVSLPGMMTGQILSGVDPLIAVRYQIMVMFMLTASTALGCMAIGYLACRRLFNERHQLCYERIQKRKKQ